MTVPLMEVYPSSTLLLASKFTTPDLKRKDLKIRSILLTYIGQQETPYRGQDDKRRKDR
jgi:hypothetical protein